RHWHASCCLVCTVVYIREMAGGPASDRGRGGKNAFLRTKTDKFRHEPVSPRNSAMRKVRRAGLCRSKAAGNRGKRPITTDFSDISWWSKRGPEDVRIHEMAGCNPNERGMQRHAGNAN